MFDLLSLPEVILLKVISYLPERDILNLMKVCRFLNNFISNSSEALQNISIRLHDYKPDSFFIFSRKYSNLQLCFNESNRIAASMFMFEMIGKQLRILNIYGYQFKLSNVVKILNCCHYLKEFTFYDHENLTIDDIDEGMLPTKRIDRLKIADLKVLNVLSKCNVRCLYVACLEQLNYEEDGFNPLREFLKCQRNLEILEVNNLYGNLEDNILPRTLKELKVNTPQPLVLYDFSEIIKIQRLEKLKATIGADPKFLNQFAELKSLTYLDLRIHGMGLRIFANLNVMQHVQYLTVDDKMLMQDFIVKMFPNLKYLKVLSADDFPLILEAFLRNSLRVITGNVEVSLLKIPSVMNEINFCQYETFIKHQKVENGQLKVNAMLTKTHLRDKEIELNFNVTTPDQIIDLRMILRKNKNLSLSSPFHHQINRSYLTTIDEKTLHKITSHLNYKELLGLRLVCRKLFNSISDSPNFLSRTQFELHNLNNLNHETLLRRNYSKVVLTLSDFSFWCPTVFHFDQIGGRLTKLVLHVHNDVNLMILRHLLSFCRNLKEIEIYESKNFYHSAVQYDENISSDLANLTLDSLKVKENLRVLSLFHKSQIKFLSIVDPTRTFNLHVLLKSIGSSLERLDISNRDSVHCYGENQQIKKILDEHFNLNFVTHDFLGVEFYPLIEFIEIDSSMVGCIKKLTLRKLENWSIFNGIFLIEELYLIDSKISISTNLPFVKRLKLESCQIIKDKIPELPKYHEHLKVEDFIKIIMDRNPKLERIENNKVIICRY